MNLNSQIVLILCQMFKIIVKHIIKKHETLTTIPSIHVYINRINNRLVLKTKNGYKLELQTPETMKLFDNTKELIDKTKNGVNVLNFEVVEVVLVSTNISKFNININKFKINKFLKYCTLLHR